jgi:hypothetical protein
MLGFLDRFQSLAEYQYHESHLGGH